MMEEEKRRKEQERLEVEEQFAFHVPKMLKEIPYDPKTNVKGPLRIEIASFTFFKNFCLEPVKYGGGLNLQDRNTSNKGSQLWMMHCDPYGQFFRLENLGSRKFLGTPCQPAHVQRLSSYELDNWTKVTMQAYDSTSSDDQKWRMLPLDDKGQEFAIQHYRDGRVLSVQDRKLEAGKDVDATVMFNA